MKTRFAIAWAAIATLAGAAQAQSGGSIADIGAGKKRAAVCFACHGEDGLSKIPGTPHLAGQERSYLDSALRAYRDGQTRKNPTMNAMAQPLSDRDIADIAAYFSVQLKMSSGQNAAQVIEAYERIRPVGQVAAATHVASAAPAAAVESAVESVGPRSGDAVYAAACAACHATAAAGAPKIGDAAAWAPRLAQGIDALVTHATKGYKGMPPKGGCMSCSDDEVKAAVEHMAAQAR